MEGLHRRQMLRQGSRAEGVILGTHRRHPAAQIGGGDLSQIGKARGGATFVHIPEIATNRMVIGDETGF